MAHVQLRPIFIGGPSVQLGQLHLIEKLNLYEALRIKRSDRKINTFKCNSGPIFWLSPTALAAFGASPWLLSSGCDNTLFQYRFSNWPFWLFCTLPVSTQEDVVTILVQKWRQEVKCYFSFTLQLGVVPKVPAEFTVCFDVASILILCVSNVFWCDFALSFQNFNLKSSCLRSIKASERVSYDWFVLYSPHNAIFQPAKRVERWLQWLWT